MINKLISEFGIKESETAGLKRYSDWLLDFMDNPVKCLTNMRDYYRSIPIKETELEVSDILSGMNGAFTREHATNLGRQLIIKEFKRTELTISKCNIGMKNNFKLEAASIRDKIKLLFTTIEMNNPLNNINGIKADRIMSKYFNNRLEEIEKPELINSINDMHLRTTFKNSTTAEFFTALPMIYNNALNYFESELISAIDRYKDKSSMLKTGYDTKDLTIIDRITEKYGSCNHVVPKMSLLGIAISKGYNIPTHLSLYPIDSFANLINDIVKLLPIVKEKAELLCNCLDRLSTADFELYDEVLKDFLENGVYKFAKPEITIDEMRKISDFNLEFLSYVLKNDISFIMCLDRASGLIDSILNFYVKLTDIVYRCFNRII